MSWKGSNMTSLWSIKDIEKKSRMFPEISSKDNAIPANTLAWVIMDVQAEDPHGKSNSFWVPYYDSLMWREMIHLGAYRLNDMAQKEMTATSCEETTPQRLKHHKLWSQRIVQKDVHLVRPNQRSRRTKSNLSLLQMKITEHLNQLIVRELKHPRNQLIMVEHLLELIQRPSSKMGLF